MRLGHTNYCTLELYVFQLAELLAVNKLKHCWNSPDIELLGYFRMIINIYFSNAYGLFKFGSNILQYWLKGLTWTAPRCTESEQHRHLGFQNQFFKIACVYSMYHNGCVL